jgi:hypothetical protein
MLVANTLCWFCRDTAHLTLLFYIVLTAVAGGLGVDWVYGKLGAKFAYDVQLRDNGQYGFLLPDDQIIPSGKETLEALKALAKYVRNN